MGTVCLNVHDVVKAIDGTCRERKREKYRERYGKVRYVEQTAVEKQGEKNKGVLYPLLRPQYAENGKDFLYVHNLYSCDPSS